MYDRVTASEIRMNCDDDQQQQPMGLTQGIVSRPRASNRSSDSNAAGSKGKKVDDGKDRGTSSKLAAAAAASAALPTSSSSPAVTTGAADLQLRQQRPFLSDALNPFPAKTAVACTP